MCLITEQASPKILEEDKTVYKVVTSTGEGWKSQYERFPYIPGQLYATEIHVSKGDGMYSDQTAQNYYEKEEQQDKLFTIGRGFHSFETEERAEEHLGLLSEILVKCTIPKGSEYWEDATGLIASNQIILHKE